LSLVRRDLIDREIGIFLRLTLGKDIQVRVWKVGWEFRGYLIC
jgi:hypothetical protein